MRPIYWRWNHVLKPLFDFYCKQQKKDITYNISGDRFYMDIYQLFVKDFHLTDIIQMKDEKVRKMKKKEFRKYMKEQEQKRREKMKDQIKIQPITDK